MKRFAPLWLVPAFCVWAAFHANLAPKVNAALENGEKKDVEELIRDLSDKRYSVREAATRLLIARKDATPALQKVVLSADLEVARRISLILRAHEERAEQEAFTRLKHFGKSGEVDLAIELLARRPKWRDEDAAFQVMTGLAARLIETAREEFGGVVPRPEALPVGNFRQFAQRVKPVFLAERHVVLDRRKNRKDQRGPYVARGQDITVVFNGGDDLLVASGAVHAAIKPNPCVLFSGGSVDLDSICFSLVICDGDFTARGEIDNCLIVARGAVRCGRASGSRIVTSSQVRFGPGTHLKDTVVKESQPTPLGFVRFFDPAREGIMVEPAKGGVRVKDADAAKPFAKAGLRQGDLIVSLGGEAVASPEVFRRVLRTKMVEAGNIRFRVRREGRAVEISVPAPR